MRVIVQLLKIFVGAAFLLYAAGFAFLIGASVMGMSDITTSVFGGIGIVLSVFGFVSLVLVTGVVAMLISAHDRLCDLVAVMEERNEILRGQEVVA